MGPRRRSVQEAHPPQMIRRFSIRPSRKTSRKTGGKRDRAENGTGPITVGSRCRGLQGRKTGQPESGTAGKRDWSNYCGIGRKTELVQLLWDCGGVVCSAAEGHAAFEDSDRGMRLMGGCGVSQPAIRIAGAGWIGRIDDHN